VIIRARPVFLPIPLGFVACSTRYLLESEKRCQVSTL
jgi:hypothetical protein